jgi:hypothetical protein
MKMAIYFVSAICLFFTHLNTFAMFATESFIDDEGNIVLAGEALHEPRVSPVAIRGDSFVANFSASANDVLEEEIDNLQLIGRLLHTIRQYESGSTEVEEVVPRVKNLQLKTIREHKRSTQWVEKNSRHLLAIQAPPCSFTTFPKLSVRLQDKRVALSNREAKKPTVPLFDLRAVVDLQAFLIIHEENAVLIDDKEFLLSLEAFCKNKFENIDSTKMNDEEIYKSLTESLANENLKLCIYQYTLNTLCLINNIPALDEAWEESLSRDKIRRRSCNLI